MNFKDILMVAATQSFGAAVAPSVPVILMNATPVAPPAVDATLQGSGWPYSAGGGFLEAEKIWVGYDGINDDLTYTCPIGGDVGGGAANYIAKVRIYDYTGTATDITAETWNTTLSLPAFHFKPESVPGFNGEVTYTADIYPLNGYVKRVTWTCTLNTSVTGLLTRAERFVSTTGSDANTGTAGSPWRHIGYAMTQMTDAAFKGGILRVAPGSYVEDTNYTVTVNTRQVTVTPTVGNTRSSVTITWLSRTTNSITRGNGVWRVALSQVNFQEITFDWATMAQISGREVSNATFVDFYKCDHIDSNGVGGPQETGNWWRQGGAKSATAPMLGTGYYNYGILQNTFRANEGQKYSARECNISMIGMTQLSLARNIVGNITFDVLYISADISGIVNTMNNTRLVNGNIAIDTPFPQRRHDVDHLTINEAVYDGTGATYIAVDEINGVGGVTIQANPNDQPASFYKWKTGTNATNGLNGGSRASGTGGNDESLWYGGAHLQAQNRAFTATISNATPAVISATGHRLIVGTPVVFTTTGALPTGITAGTTYYIIATGFTANSFQIAATRGGAAIATSSAGSGTHTCTMTGLIVSGDFSTATGFTSVGDQIVGAIIGHADLCQYATQGAANPCPDGLFVYRWKASGAAIGNLMLLQPANTTAAQSGTIDITGTGNTYTTSVAISPVAGEDFLKIRTGANKGQYARIVTYAAQAGTLSKAITVAAGQQYGLIKSAKNIFWKDCILSCGETGVLAQWVDAITNFSLRTSTIFSGPTQAVANTAGFLFRDDQTPTPPSRACADGLSVVDCLMEAFENESGSFPGAPENALYENNRARRGTLPGTGNVGSVTTNAAFTITAGTSVPTCASARPGWTYAGVQRVAGVTPIGANG
jgi:hypothetical protein